MKISSIKPGQPAYIISRYRMGNTTLRSVRIHRIDIISVDAEAGKVTASIDGGSPHRYGEYHWSKWRLKRPVLVRNRLGQARLATRAEIAEQASPATPQD